MAFSSSSRNWEYDVFLSFRGEDVRSNFRSHLLKELEKKLIIAFKDDETMRSMSLWPELEKAIRNSRVAVVIFSENYASSSWCLNELLEIMNCEAQQVIPVFYSVDPSDVRGQKNDFGRIFEKTCERESKEKKSQWKAALTNVANKLGYHSNTGNDEAKMIEDIANVVLKILVPNPSRDFERFVGLEDHLAKMSELLQLDSKEVKMVGLWGPSGIGKTVIARYLFYQLSRNFQVKKFIDKAFVYKSKEIYCGANPDDNKMKLHLLKKFLSEILGKESIEIDQLGAVEERLKNWKFLLIIDDLDDLMVLETLVGNLDWFGSGSRIIVVTKDRQFLRSHKIDLIYEVSLPTEDHGIEMLCQSAFNQKSPLDGFEEVVVKVIKCVGSLPIALTVLGRDLRQREKEYWVDMLRRIQNGEYSKLRKYYMASSSSSRNWEYDVFLSFRGEDVRSNFRSHLLKELEKKLIIAFKDNETMRSMSLWPELEKAIRNSRVAVVIFSENYASSSWCLNELLEIMNCKDQKVIPVFYRVDPSDVRKQVNDFGRIFEETCERESKEKKSQWKAALTNVANKGGYHSNTGNDEAKMIEDIANVVLKILVPNPSRDFERFVGLEDHFTKMSKLLQLESKEVKMVGIWGSSGIGKTVIARYLFYQLSRNFQVKKFIDKAFVYKSKEIYCGANPDDYNMKLHLLKNFLSEILGKEGIEIDQLGTLEERLKHWKVLLIIDDLDDLMVLETLVGNLDWFGSGSRIIVVTKDRQFLRSHKIDLIYEVSLPTEDHGIEMLCQSAFNQKSPLDGFEEVVVKVVKYVGSLPIALTVLGRDLWQREKEYWIDVLRRIQNRKYSKIEKVLRLSYDGLESGDDKTLFCYIACYLNHREVKDIKLFLGDSNLYVYSGLRNLKDKSLIHVRTSTGIFGDDESYVEMHCLLQEMGKKMTGLIKNPGEFLVDSKDILEVLTKDNGTEKVLGIRWRFGEESDLSHFHEISFKGMSKLRYLNVDFLVRNYNRLILPERLDYLPPTLELLRWSFYPLRYIASGFSPENLVKLEMEDSKLEELWEGVVPLSGLRSMHLRYSTCLKKIPNLSKATNLEELDLYNCSSLVELPSSIRNLNKLLKLDMGECKELKTIPTGFILKSLNELNFHGCSKLTTFPEFSTNISVLHLSSTAIKEIPSNWYPENLVQFSMVGLFDSEREESDEVQQLTPFIPMLSPTLRTLDLLGISNLVELPYSFKNLQSLEVLNLRGCSRLKSFRYISTNIEKLNLGGTGIEEVPWWIEKFSRLKSLSMEGCKKLRHVSFNISKLKNLIELKFRDCGALIRVDMCGPSFSPPDNCVPKAKLDFSHCYSLDPESLLQHQLFMFKFMILPGKEVPSYFTHKTIGTSSPLAIPLLNIPHSQPFFRVKICVVLNSGRYSDIKLNFQLKGEFENCYYCACFNPDPSILDCFVEGSHLYILDCRLPRYKDKAPADQRNYDHVNMKIHVDDDIIYNPQFGILVSEYSEDSYDSDMDLVTENATQLLISKKRDSTFVDADEDGMLNLNEPIEECGEKHKKPRKVSKD